jgi:DNA helicase-2/ATP-dependent DNA helicase PcrA
MRAGRGLIGELSKLDDRQRSVVTHTGNVVALAGPGAGKTRTIVARAGYLLSEVVGPRHSVAAITYTNKAAREVGKRLSALGLRPGRGRLASRTIHSFCLNEIIRPLGRLANDPSMSLTDVIDQEARELLLEKCLDEHGLLQEKVQYLQSRITRVRRALSAGQDASGFGQAWISAMGTYEEALVERGLVDFDSMVSHALAILRDYPSAAKLFVTKTPHVIVDEYQDLGPVLLHQIVLQLLKLGVSITAVGDPDQVMYAYEGASPEYINELAARDDFEVFPLNVNYRSVPTIIKASEAVLGEKRGYTSSDPSDQSGSINQVSVGVSLEAHAVATKDVVLGLLGEGIPAEEIAILYPSKGPLQEALEVALSAASVPVLWERGRAIPPGKLSDFLAQAASRALTGPLPAGLGRAVVGEVPVLKDLAVLGVRLTTGDAARVTDGESRALGRHLVDVLDRASWEPDGSGKAFVDAMVSVFANELPAELQREATDIAAILSDGDMAIAELAGGRIPGRVVATTYHSSKGREFLAVILPGLCEGLVPRYSFDWVGKEWIVTSQAVAESRRNFYVAVTRAEKRVTLISGPGWWSNGRPRLHGPTRFVGELMAALEQD